MGGSVLGALQSIFQFFTTQGGILIISIIIAIGFIRAAAEHHARPAIWGIIGGVGLFSTSWIVTTWLGG